jgi:hypothetical protein
MKRKTKPQPHFVRNDSADIPETQFQRLTVNFKADGIRMDTLEDRPHTVIPMVMILEGVFNGSSGPLFYPSDELGKTPQVWNHKPIVVYHPELNGEGISACDPAVVNARKVGVIMNTKFEKKTKRLKAEAWVENTRAEKVDKRVMDAVNNHKMMEVSTGLFLDLEKTEGTFNSKKYIGIVRNIRADHLAILPDKIGACSLFDGAGLCRNEAGVGDETITALGEALKKKFSFAEAKLESVHSNFIIYNVARKFYSLGYSTSESGVSLSEETPVEVIAEYRTVEGTPLGNQDQSQKNKNKETDMNKAQKIAAIIAVANCGWDQKALEALNEQQLESVHKGLVGNTPPEDKEKKKDDEEDPKKKKGKGKNKPTKNDDPEGDDEEGGDEEGTNNESPRFRTVEEFFAAAPQEFAPVLRNMNDSYVSEVKTLIGKITANKESGYTEAELKGYDIVQLRKLAKLATPKEAPEQRQVYGYNYMGQAPVTGNTGEPKDEPVLVAPVLNFKKEGK